MSRIINCNKKIYEKYLFSKIFLIPESKKEKRKITLK